MVAEPLLPWVHGSEALKMSLQPAGLMGPLGSTTSSLQIEPTSLTPITTTTTATTPPPTTTTLDVGHGREHRKHHEQDRKPRKQLCVRQIGFPAW